MQAPPCSKVRRKKEEIWTLKFAKKMDDIIEVEWGRDRIGHFHP